MTNPGPITQNERLEIIDVLRGLAVCGILIGNMQWFSGYGMIPPALEAQQPLADQITRFLVHFFVEGKFYSIFSFLFGFGFALQIARAEERGDARASVFKRRLVWLLVIGLLHAYLLWSGDILSIYAVMGFILLLFRKKPDRSLLKWAGILLAIPIVTYLVLYIIFISFAPPDVPAKVAAGQSEFWNNASQSVPTSSYWQIISDYNLKGLIGRYLGLFFQMRLPKILAMFLLGFYAYRRGFFQNLDAHRPLIRRVLIWGLALGLLGNIAFAALAGNEAVFPPTTAGIIGVVTYAFGVPALALFFVALAATLWQKELSRQVLGFISPVGRMALTNYLMHTVVCVFLFYGFGFGQFGKFGAMQATLTALGIFSAQIVLSNLWLRAFNYGPMEWVWRCLTYKRMIPLRREALL